MVACSWCGGGLVWLGGVVGGWGGGGGVVACLWLCVRVCVGTVRIWDTTCTCTMRLLDKEHKVYFRLSTRNLRKRCSTTLHHKLVLNNHIYKSQLPAKSIWHRPWRTSFLIMGGPSARESQVPEHSSLEPLSSLQTTIHQWAEPVMTS